MALAHSLMTPYTSFVAIEHKVVPGADGKPARVDVPVEMPEGVSPDRIFGSLSMERLQPGDPELRVHAPADAREVSAVFPFGDTKAAEWDPRAGAWVVRFLVPKGTPEGVYDVWVLVTLADGTRDRWTVSYTVDAGAPKLDLKALGPIVPGQPVTLQATQIPTESDAKIAAAGGHRLKAVIYDDVSRVDVRTPDGAIIAFSETAKGVWQATWIPAAADQTLVLTAVDGAGNTGTLSVELR
jgi:hypothetical protein